MARATRSSTQLQEKEKLEKEKPAQHIQPVSSRSKAASKKRKRVSLTGSDDQPASKQLRGDALVANGDFTHDMDQDADGSSSPEHKLPALANAGDVPINSDDAHKILDILEMIDTQGLLDRVFPLTLPAAEPSTSKETASPTSYSFRALLKESSQYPLCVLRSAIHRLLPITSHPRARPSTPATEQLRFCNLALSLLDQASFHSVPIPLDLESILPSTTEEDVETKAESEDAKSLSATLHSPASPVPRKQKYALMQRLPTGEWWTSLNSDIHSSSDLKDLPTAHAELAAILPAAPRSKSDMKDIPTLGSYAPKKVPGGMKQKLPAPRHVSCGSFLDYGPYASFAPSFDQDGKEVGRAQLGEVISGWAEVKRRRELATMQTASVVEVIEDAQDDTPNGILEGNSLQKDKHRAVDGQDIVDSLDGLLSRCQIDALKSTMESLELEAGVQELLDRNRRALERLEVLQAKRLGAQNGGSSVVEEGSEEWDTAQGIMDSLTLLASLRPCSSQHATPPLIPPPSVLHKLHLTLLPAPTAGWHGTLPPSRKHALRDDSTLRLRTGATVALPPSTTTVTTTAVTPAATGAQSQPYAAYSYSPYATQQYRAGAGYLPYKPGQATAYYPGAYPATTPGQAQAASSYYPAQYTLANQQSYPYTAGWYNYQPPASGATSGRGTPQPYTAQQPTPAKAVSNTVVGNKTYTPGTWGGAMPAGYVQPTLPAHLRSATTGVSTAYQVPPAYYGAYQATPSAAR